MKIEEDRFKAMVEFMTVQEVAGYLRVTTKTISRLLKERKIPASKVGRQWRFDRNSIDEWLRRNSNIKSSILVIDDEEVIRELLKETIEELGHTVYCADSAEKGLEIFRQVHCDLVFLDLKMPVMDGAELLGHLKVIKPKIPAIIITGYPDSEVMSRALAQGPFGVINKPFRESDIITSVNTFLKVI